MRRRATVVVIDADNRVLLVRERGESMYSLPGGGIKAGEPPMAAAARELYEETGLECSRLEWRCRVQTPDVNHLVFVATPYGRVVLDDYELTGFIWWDGKRGLPTRDNTKTTLRRTGFLPATKTANPVG